MRESALHAALKTRLAPPGSLVEALVDGMYVDILDSGLVMEVQTRGFSSIRRKLERLLETHDVQLIHPIPAEKWIVLMDADGALVHRRKSPRRGRAVDVFCELVSIAHLVDHPRFTLRVLMTSEEDIRRADGAGSWRRKGVSLVERRLLDVVEDRLLQSPEEVAGLLGAELPEEFTSAELRDLAGVSKRAAGQVAYCLRKMGLTQTAGKRGRAYVYARQGRDCGAGEE